MPWTITLDEFDTYEAAREGFRWDFPTDYNVAEDCVRKHEERDRTALYQAYPDGRRETYSFADLDHESDRLANALEARGIEAGDRVAVCLPQIPETLCFHLACWKLAAISIPLAVTLGEQAIEKRIENSEAKLIVTDDTTVETVTAGCESCSSVETVVLVGEEDDLSTTLPIINYEMFISGYSPGFEIAETTPKTPSSILYTSGTTGPPKGVLQHHEYWPGHCPGVYMSYENDVDETAVGWTAASWSSVGSLGNVIFGMWHYGGSVVGYPMESFDPQKAFELMAEFGVTHTWLSPTMLRKMTSVDDIDAYDLSLSVITAGSEKVTSDLFDWVNTHLEDTYLNETYGQTEASAIVMDCQSWFEQRPGSTGKAVPGHDVAIIDPETGEEKPRGEIGRIAIRDEDDPTLLSEYWRMPERTAEKKVGDWVLTGDLGRQDENDYIWFLSRSDDVIISSGHNISPEEIEGNIAKHEAVAEVGVIGVDDETRGQIIKAFVELHPGVDPTDSLKAELKEWVRDRLAEYKAPHSVEFLSSVPISDRGKTQRRVLRQREGETNTE